MPEFFFQELFPQGDDQTDYRLLTTDHVSEGAFEGNSVTRVNPEGLTLLSGEAFRDMAHLFRTSHLINLAAILNDPEASGNDRYVALEMIKNAVISAEGVFPMCQDTGTAFIMGRKGQQVWTGGSDEEALSLGVFNAYTRGNLRYSQNVPLSLFDEKNSGTNLPAQIDIQAVSGDSYTFLFIAKGGGSSNKTFLFQESKALLNPDTLASYLFEKMKSLGTAACPPYHLAFVLGGTSPETNLKTVKLATAGYLDALPTTGNDGGRAFRVPELEQDLLVRSRKIGMGAQYGGKYFCHDIRVIRLPRHGASCPVGMGISCSAHRNARGKITPSGIFLEALDRDPARFLPEPEPADERAVHLELDRSVQEIQAVLTRYPVGTRLILNGHIVAARDMAHARLKERLDSGGGIPDYFRNHIIYYAGPAKKPEGFSSGSFGPTTALRMDSYVPEFQSLGASLIMLGKGNRSEAVTESCKRYGGFYLGSIGGTAARLGKECILDVRMLEYPDLGMEAVFLIRVKDFPVFILVDDKGNDFYSDLAS